jgi:phosphatidylserine/phosphatidylglycerophosphate/cardiolipin synthase-like enzyme
MSAAFLNPDHGPQRHAPRADCPFPPRAANRVTPRILAAEMYPDLERLVLAAATRVFLAFRVFDPLTATRSAEARAAGLGDWRALLAAKLAQGVTVRILLTDFEPSLAHGLHAGSWASFRELEEVAATLGDDERQRFEIIVSQHPGEVGWAMRQLFRLPVGIAIRRLLGGLGDAEAQGFFDVRPGLWRYHRLVDGRPRFRRGPAPRLWPATHHHKFAVIDDRVAIVGGLDVDERRWETRRYDRPAPETWHDVSVRLEGPAAGDAAEHFRRLWNAELPRFIEVTRHWLTGVERELAIEPLDPMPEPIEPAPELPAGARVQLVRTLSRRSRDPFAMGPVPYIRELMQAHRALIFAATRTLYIEAQFFRSGRAAGWIVEAARRSPALEVIVVLPQAPEEVAFQDGRSNPAHRHGEWLQARALGRLRRALGPRLGLFALGRKAPLSDREAKLVRDGGAAFRAGMIYVHSKLLIADDRLALVSSANINGRSFNWDSEFGLLWEEAGAVEAFRRRLWGQLLERRPESLPAPGAGLALWQETAAANLTRDPPDRQGFVLPYRYARVRRFGRPSWFVPDELV